MRVTKYLIISQGPKGKYGKPNVKMVDNIGKTSVPGNGVALKINVELPDEIFQKPMLEATFKVDKSMVSAPTIHPDVVTRIENIIHEDTGIKMTIAVINEP